MKEGRKERRKEEGGWQCALEERGRCTEDGERGKRNHRTEVRGREIWRKRKRKERRE